MLKSTKIINNNAELSKKIIIVYANDLKKKDLLNDIFNQLFDEIRLLDIIDELFLSDLQFIIKDFIDNNDYFLQV